MKQSLSLTLIAAVIALGIAGCSSVAPPELVNARDAYQQALNSRASQLAPAEVHKAHEALRVAEQSFKDEPRSYRTKDLAYIADRKAKMAEALATTAAEVAATAAANKDYQTTQAEIMKNTKEDLAMQTEISKSTQAELATQTGLTERSNKDLKSQTELTTTAKKDLAASEAASAGKSAQLIEEKKGRADAEQRATKAQADLVKLAAVKEEARGLVITLSGSVLFASNKSTLLPAARDRLTQVADALLETKERNIVVEGHTDAQGSSSSNMKLSQARADAVRSFIVSRGYPSDLIHAQGIGKERPVSDNNNAEGRANNRRVEIIIEPESNQ